MSRDPERHLCCHCGGPTSGLSRASCQVCGTDLCNVCGNVLNAYSHICDECVVDQFPHVINDIVMKGIVEYMEEQAAAKSGNVH